MRIEAQSSEPHCDMQLQHISNQPAVGAPFFTPAQNPVAGTALNPQLDGKMIPKLFTPLKIRDVTFQNRLFVCPIPVQVLVIVIVTRQVSSHHSVNIRLKTGTSRLGI